MAFISQHCSTPAQLHVLLELSILDISLNLDWVNLIDDVIDFLLAAAEHTNAPPVGLHDSDTILGDKTSTQCVIKRTFRFHKYKYEIQIPVPFPELLPQEIENWNGDRLVCVTSRHRREVNKI